MDRNTGNGQKVRLITAERWRLLNRQKTKVLEAEMDETE